jgi:hypothetical protein
MNCYQYLMTTSNYVVVLHVPSNNSFNRSADTQVVINTNRSMRPVNSGVRRLRHRDFVDNH